MNWLRQTLAVMWINLQTVPSRLGSSAVAIIGISGVVVVFVSVLSISAGFNAAMTGTGARDRALIMRAGSDTEMTSGLEGMEVRIIKEAPGIRREGDMALASAELYVIIDLPNKSAPESTANVPMRGIDPMGMKVHDDVKVVEGRMFRYGTNEVIVGRGASRHFANLNVGDTVISGQNRWAVVGIFEANGGVAETELWCDVQNLQSVYRRPNTFSSVLAKLDSSDALVATREWLDKNPQVKVDAKRESEYYATQSTTMTNLINTLGFGIASLMAIGAVFGAILTMYTAVASRSREIATLRALGFNTFSILVSVLAESLVLGGIGGTVGALGAYAAFDGFQTSTMNFQTFSQVAFAFKVTPALFLTGLVYALSIGLIGGLLPAIRAARLPISKALREL
jgi:putative ABC transport system permease protein